LQELVLGLNTPVHQQCWSSTPLENVRIQNYSFTFSKKRKKGKKGKNDQVIDMSQFQNLGEELDEASGKKPGKKGGKDGEEKEKEKLGNLHFSLGKH
jgi:hypothetical protein